MLLINFLDYFTTAELIKRTGFEIEANAFLRNLMYATNTPHIILLAKFIPLILFGLGMWVMKRNHPQRYALPVWKWIVWTINIVLTGIVMGSIYTLI